MQDTDDSAEASAKWDSASHEHVPHPYIVLAWDEALRVLETSDCERCRQDARYSLDGTTWQYTR